MPLPPALLAETPATHEVVLAVEDDGSDYRLSGQLTDDQGNGLDLSGCTIEAWAHSLDGAQVAQLDAAWTGASSGLFRVDFARTVVARLAPDHAGPRARRVELGSYSVAVADATHRVVVVHGPLVGVRR